VGQARRLRVLTLLDTLRPGGAERVAVSVAARLDKARFEPFVCASRRVPWSPLREILDAAEVPLLTLDRTRRLSVWRWSPLLSLLRRERIDVIHAHMFGSNVSGTIIGRLARVPVIVAHEHSWSFEANPIRYTLDRELIGRGAHVVVAVSSADRLRMIELEGVPSAKIRLVPNRIGPLPPPEQDLRAELGISPDTPVIGTLTVLRPEKALEVLVEATSLLTPRFPELKVLIAGAGREEQRLRALIAARGLEDKVLLLGFRRNVADVLAALDVAVFCSDREGSPLAVIESMSAGLPIVATRVGGVPDLVREDENALLVPVRDARALAGAVGRLLADSDLRERFGRSAHERQRRELGIEPTVRALEDLYEQLFRASRRGRREALAGGRTRTI
jgi:glycosyltransferase involved in cell wall biosynthesis